MDYSPEEREDTEKVFDAHCKACFDTFLNGDVQGNSESESDGDEEAKPSASNKFG